MPSFAPPSGAPSRDSSISSDTSIEPVLAGTLALMSHYARTPSLAAADKIARNLALLARHPEATAELQTICGRLFLQWLGPLQLQDAPAEGQWRDVFPEPPLAQ